MSFAHMTPEMRKAAGAKAAATRAANRQKKAAQAEVEDVSFSFLDAAEYGSAVEQEEPKSLPVPNDPADPYELFLLSLDDDTRRLLSDTELRDIFNAQKQKAADERRAKLKKGAVELALNTARASEGLVAAETQEQIATKRQNARPVAITIQLPPAGDEGQIADVGLRIDGKILYHGTRHECTYGEAASLREIMYRAMEHELMFKGQKTRERQWLMGLAHGQYGRHIGGN